MPAILRTMDSSMEEGLGIEAVSMTFYHVVFN
jgi:hypothetical protein